MNSFIDVGDGVRLRIRTLGSGRPVLLIHGWTLAHEVWDRPMQVLAAAGHQAIAIDLRGHGDSDAPLAGYGVEQLAADAAAVLRAVVSVPATVVGWSLGGLTALRMAYDYPDLVSGVVTVASVGAAHVRHDAYPYGPPAGEPAESALRAFEFADRIRFRRKAIGDLFKDVPAPHVLDWLHGVSLRTPGWVAGACLSTLFRTEQTALLKDITVPVSQIIGTHDPGLSVEGAKWVQEQVDGRLTELDCGHYPMLECPDDFDRALLSVV
ncbi:alpha/beta fold hydrolase [Mycolicibacterium bacteremicum]|uniref:Alpha/beta hydrolase n=1 Tax=Mycolicibacterium bacteremicum TaxID=564198 RepID=A0A1W9YX12_MYCBA|nr:alpha/beta hydrolase [Mycolicibacterium bacteremicum]MCV7431603.1 alpha/beta hydrolase [Mycolicibacterium bacteremicum]ORA04519.1 alpha/beta hydrolase [Mycolicibacterium bacteremicum]